MSVDVDEAIWRWRGLRWAHLLADDLDELHRFAHKLGIHRSSFQAPPRSSSPHYDITAFERRRALALGAIPCSRAQIVAVLRRNQQNAARQVRLPEACPVSRTSERSRRVPPS